MSTRHFVSGTAACYPISALRDFSDDAGTRELMKRLESLIALSRAHLDAETREISTALDVRYPSPAPVRSDDTAGHRHALAELESLIRSVNVATPARRNIAGHALYRCFALFAAADIEHMNSEETEVLILAAPGFQR